MLRIVAMPDERQELGVVAPDRAIARAGPAIDDFYDLLAIVVALQPRIPLTFEVRGIPRTPVQLPVPVADDTEGEAAKRVAAV
jgi:hypothetical protein